MGYEKPTIVSLGSLADLTQATVIVGTEDAGSKSVDEHHSIPTP